ncbi:hypothetical protein Tco_0565675 [Tanacetum coccineum]
MTYGNGFDRLVYFIQGGVNRDEVPWWLGGVEKVKALGANGDVSGSRVRVVWMEVGGEIIRERVVSRVVVGLVMRVVLKGWEVFVRWFWMGELS